ncbi:hypothetical protein ACP3S7_00345 [Phytobacter ursingii]
MAAQAPDPGYVLGGLGAVMTPATSASSSGFVLALVGGGAGTDAERAAQIPSDAGGFPGWRRKRLIRAT